MAVPPWWGGPAGQNGHLCPVPNGGTISTAAGQAEYLALYRERGQQLRGLARRILQELADPDDALAPALTKLWEEGSTDPERLKQLVVDEARILRKKVLRSRQREAPIGLLPDFAELEEEQLAQGRPLTLDVAQFRRAHDSAVRELPELERDAYILTDLRGLTVRETAAVLAIPKSTAADRTESARTFIRKEVA